MGLRSLLPLLPSRKQRVALHMALPLMRSPLTATARRHRRECREFLATSRSDVYAALLRSGRLDDYLTSVGETASERLAHGGGRRLLAGVPSSSGSTAAFWQATGGGGSGLRSARLSVGADRRITMFNLASVGPRRFMHADRAHSAGIGSDR